MLSLCAACRRLESASCVPRTHLLQKKRCLSVLTKDILHSFLCIDNWILDVGHIELSKRGGEC